MPEPNPAPPGPNPPRPPAWPSCPNPLMTDGRRAATFSASTPSVARASIGNPSRPTTTTASTPPRRASASTTSRIVAIRRPSIGMETGEVKQPPWVDPLGRRAVSSPHRMPPHRRIAARDAALTGLALLVVACNDTSNLPAPLFTNVVDTVSLFALRGTAITLPSAYTLEGAQPVRTDQTTQLDFAFDFDSLGAPALFPTGAINLGQLSGLQRSTTPFNAITLAPTGGYIFDKPLALGTGTVGLVRSRPTTCSFGGTVALD